MTERQEKIKQIFEENDIYLAESDIENLGMAIALTLEFIADEIEREEPYATNTIDRYREASRDIDTEING